jgi:hypothetical protein
MIRRESSLGSRQAVDNPVENHPMTLPCNPLSIPEEIIFMASDKRTRTLGLFQKLAEKTKATQICGWLLSAIFLFNLQRLPASTASWLIVGMSRKDLRLFRFLLVHSRNCEAILTTSSDGFSGSASIKINPMGLASGLRRPTRA